MSTSCTFIFAYTLEVDFMNIDLITEPEHFVISGGRRLWTLSGARTLLFGWSVDDLAAKSGLSVNAVRNAENGACATNAGTAILLAKALGLSVDEIHWPLGLTDRGRRPLTGKPCTPNELEQQCVCPVCFTRHSLGWKPGDACEDYS